MPILLLLAWLGGWWYVGLVVLGAIVGAYEMLSMLTAAGYKVKLSNHGVNMIITDDLLDGTHGVPRSWVAEMKSSKADIVVINTGLNDAALARTGWDDMAHVKTRWTQLVKIAIAHG